MRTSQEKETIPVKFVHIKAQLPAGGTLRSYNAGRREFRWSTSECASCILCLTKGQIFYFERVEGATLAEKCSCTQFPGDVTRT